MYEYVFFDLDGTITDPEEAIVDGVSYALKQCGYAIDEKKLKLFIGPPLIDSFQNFYNMPYELASQAVDLYRQRYREDGLLKNNLYEGIVEVLQELKRLGKKIVLATSKPEAFSIEILEHYDILKYFDFVSGATFTNERITKSSIIKYALDNLHINDPRLVIMVGDRKYDILGAREFGIKTIAVLYGYGSQEEFIENQAAYIVGKAEEIIDIIKECEME